MKKTLFLVLVCISSSIVLPAQSAPTSLKKIMELKMPKTADDEMPGTRGASMVWHPVQKKYYASFAGNAAFPLAVFDAKGKRLSEDDLEAFTDVRGLWYNPSKKLVSGNAYNEYGWFTYQLDKAGIPTDLDEVNEGMNQPDAQSVGAYNTATKQVLFLFRSQVYMYNSDGETQDSVAIHWGRKKADGVDEDEDITDVPEDYNYTTLVYTGIKGQEIGFLNITNKEVELYDLKTGFLSKKLAFPETAITESAFNFAYTNGMYWLFNMELRKWVAYK